LFLFHKDALAFAPAVHNFRAYLFNKGPFAKLGDAFAPEEKSALAVFECSAVFNSSG